MNQIPSSRTRAGRRLLSGLAFSLAGLLLATAAVEAAVRIFAPANLDFYNWQAIKRISDRPGHPFEFIPGSRNDFYVGVPVQINSIGLRDVEIEIPKPAGVRRIVVIGDSVTFGYGVRLENTYLKILEADLNEAGAGARYQVVNAGMDATGLDRHYEFLESSAASLQPDLVTVALTLNDIANYDRAPETAPARQFSERGLVRRLNTFLLFHSEAYLTSYLDLKSLLYRYGVLDFNDEHAYDLDILREPSEEIEQAWTSTRSLLSRIATLARERRYPLAFVIFPIEIQLDARALEKYERELRVNVGDRALTGEPQQELIRFGKSIDVPVVDLLPAFRKAGRDDLFLRGRSMKSDPVHPSVAGHQVAGHALFQRLIQEPAFAAVLPPKKDHE